MFDLCKIWCACFYKSVSHYPIVRSMEFKVLTKKKKTLSIIFLSIFHNEKEAEKKTQNKRLYCWKVYLQDSNNRKSL